MDGIDAGFLALQVRVLLEEVMSVDEMVIRRNALIFRGAFRQSPEEAFSWMREALRKMELIPMLSRRGRAYEVRVVPEVFSPPSNPAVNALLFAATLVSTLLVGAQMEGVNILAHPWRFAAGLPFAGSILAILVVHEFGHYLMSSFHGVVASLPYFIPAPTMIGTLGAVIKTKSPIPDRKSLLDIGAAGPLCGFLVALVALGVGLSLAEVADLSPALRGGVMEYGDSLVTMLMTRLVKGPIPEGKIIMQNPIIFAGWVGLLITAFNLMPVGQLDGGHIIYALIGRWHGVVARFFIAALFAAGWFLWEGWFVWAFVIIILGPYHTAPLNDVTPLNTGRKLIVLAAFAVFVASLVPVPVRFRNM